MSDAESSVEQQVKEMASSEGLGFLDEAPQEAPETEPVAEPSAEVEAEPEITAEPEAEVVIEPVAEPEGEPEAETAEGEEPESEEPEGKRDFEKAYFELLEESSGKINEARSQELGVPKPQRVEAQPKAEPESEPIVEQKALPFVTSEQFEAMLSDVNSFNTVLQGVYKRARQDAHLEALRAVPEIVNRQVSTAIGAQALVRDFYTEYAYLHQYRKTCRALGNELAAEHPDWDLSAVLKQIPVEMKSRYGIDFEGEPVKPAPSRKGGRQRKPAFAATTTRKVPAPVQIDPIAAQIAEMRSTSGFEE